MVDKAHIQTDVILYELERRINRIYWQAESESMQEIELYLFDMVIEEGTQNQRLDHAKKNGLIAMVAVVASILIIANKKAIKTTNSTLPQIYTINYAAMSKMVKSLSGVLLPARKIQTVSDLLTRMDLRAIKEMTAKKHISNDIMKTVMQGIKKGESASQIANRVRQVENMSKNRSILIARTESTRTENNARMDVFSDAARRGIGLKKQWVATSDNRTRDSHAAINGEIKPIKVLFSNGLLKPGDPNGKPEEVCNCRCVIIPVLEGYN